MRFSVLSGACLVLAASALVQAQEPSGPLSSEAVLPGVAPPATATSTESCDDGVRNGPESDVDCGGDCPPCERKAACNDAPDCLSGLCARGVCAERRLAPGAPIPAGYEARLARHDAAASVRLVGGVFSGVGYGAAYFAAVSYPSKLGALYVPVLGPWVGLRQIDPLAAKVLLVADGAIQGAGAILLIGGVAGAGKQLVKKPKESARVVVQPSITVGAWGLLLHGRF